MANEAAALETYFRLKNKAAKLAKKNKKASQPEQCVNCKKPGGTLFSQTRDFYMADCQAEKPCKLHMKISRQYTVLARPLLEQYRAILKEAEEKILVLKSDLDYNFTSTEQAQMDFKDANDHYEATRFLFDKVQDFIRASAREAEQQALETEIVDVLARLRLLLEDCKKIKQGAVDEYVAYFLEKLTPAIEQLRAVKYDYVYLNVKQYKNNVGYWCLDGGTVPTRDMQSILVEKRDGQYVL
jgi:hypothetical protein